VSRNQKGKTNLDFTEARDSQWQWHQLGHMQVCTSLQTDNHTDTSPVSFFTGRMPFLPLKALKAQNLHHTAQQYPAMARFKEVKSSATLLQTHHIQTLITNPVN